MSIESSANPGEFTQFEHDGWETVSRGYQQHFAALTSQSVDAVLDAAAVGAGTRMLDLCCGPGVLAAAAQARGAKVLGIDFSAEAVELASAAVPAAEFGEGDAQALALDDDSFDAVVCGFGIIHLSDPQQALHEMQRVLKPGGRVAVSVWQPPAANNGFGLLFGAIKQHADMGVPLPHGPDFFQFSDPANLADALAQSGLRDPQTLDVDQFWELDEAGGLITCIMEGAVRARGLMLAQTDAVRQATFAAVAAGMESYAGADGKYRVPMPAIVGSASK